MGLGMAATTTAVRLTMEQRKEKRFELTARTTFRWESSQGIAKNGEGTTRDISANGVFVLSDEEPLPGTSIEVDIFLPSLSGRKIAILLHGMGKVVRTTHALVTKNGFAAQVNFEHGDLRQEDVFTKGGRFN